jgi:hypothetical protein
VLKLGRQLQHGFSPASILVLQQSQQPGGTGLMTF